MDRGLIDAFEIKFKSAFRNLKFAILLCAMLFAFSFYAEAQQATKIPRIGVLNASSAASMASRIELFRQGLRDLGYIEGQNLIVEYRYADGKLNRYRTLRLNWHDSTLP
jgi:putative ABC transport system substrate-binding protein